MTTLNTDTSALRALQEAATRGSTWVYGGQGWVFANAEVVGAPYGEFRDLFASVQNDQDGVYLVALMNEAPDLLAKAEAYDQLRGLVAELRSLQYFSNHADGDDFVLKDELDLALDRYEALAIPAGPKDGE